MVKQTCSSQSFLRQTNSDFRKRMPRIKLKINPIIEYLHTAALEKNIEKNKPLNIFEIINKMKNHPFYKVTGTSPKTNLVNGGIWTKKQWYLYHALSTYILYLNNTKKKLLNYLYIRKVMNPKSKNIHAPIKLKEIKQKIQILEKQNHINLYDFIDLFKMFDLKSLRSMGY